MSCFPLDVGDPSLQLVTEIKCNVSAVKSITTYLKQSGFNKKLKANYSLKHDFVHLKSYDENKDDVEMILNLNCWPFVVKYRYACNIKLDKVFGIL